MTHWHPLTHKSWNIQISQILGDMYNIRITGMESLKTTQFY